MDKSERILKQHGDPLDAKAFFLAVNLALQVLDGTPLARSLAPKGDFEGVMLRLDKAAWRGLILDDVDVVGVVRALLLVARSVYGFGHGHMRSIVEAQGKDSVV